MLAQETEQDIPALESKPDLSLEAIEIAQAFNVLSKLRTSNGFGLNPISISEIKAYIEIFGDPFDDVLLFVELITEMDSVFLELKRE